MKTIISFNLINLKGQGFHLCIMAFINDKKVRLLIDTGASKTVLDKERFEKISANSKIKAHKHEATGLGTNKMKAFETVIKKIKIGKLESKNYKIGLLDLSHVNKSYEALKLKTIDGVLGSDYLKKYKAIINYEKKIISLTNK
jgi:predicted aspartyl protease